MTIVRNGPSSPELDAAREEHTAAFAAYIERGRELDDLKAAEMHKAWQRVRQANETIGALLEAQNGALKR